MKTLVDIKFIKSCKLENIISTFAKVKLSLKQSNCKLRLHIARLVMEAEMQNKHFENLETKERDETYWNPTQTLPWFDIIQRLHLPEQQSR